WIRPIRGSDRWSRGERARRVYTHDDDADVVLAAALVRLLNERIDRALRTVGRREDALDDVVGHHLAETVGAQEVDVARARLAENDVDRHNRPDADGPAQM